MQAHRMVIHRAFFIVSSWLLVSLVGVKGSCSDHALGSICICTNFSSDPYSGNVSCNDGGEKTTLEDVAEVARENNGVLGMLFLSGIDLKSLEPLTGALVEVRKSLVIDGTGVESLEPLSSLRKIGGSFRIFNNSALTRVGPLGNLSHVHEFLRIGSNAALVEIRGFGSIMWLGVLLIDYNANLRVVDAFDSLLVTDGLLIANNQVLEVVDMPVISVVQDSVLISGNSALKKFRMARLKLVGKVMNFVSDGYVMPSFEAREGLPYVETGCFFGDNMIPNFDNGSYVFETRLVMRRCKVNNRLPLIVGFGIIGATVIFSMCIFHHMMSQYFSPVGMTMTLEQLRGMFSVHTLAVADVLSDLGFIVTVFAVGKVDMWDDNKIHIEFSSMYLIGYISIFVVILSQACIMIGTWWGLWRVELWRTAALSPDTGGERPSKSFMQHLITERRMCWRHWMLLFPGLLVFDTEVVKHLPWGKDVLGSCEKGSKDGFPHSFFAGVAFWSAVIEDIPQIGLQILFIFVAEGENGWAITGAMASLTVSVADALVRVAFPLLVGCFAAKAPPRPHNCMGKRQEVEGGIEADAGVDFNGDEESTQDSS